MEAISSFLWDASELKYAICPSATQAECFFSLTERRGSPDVLRRFPRAYSRELCGKCVLQDTGFRIAMTQCGLPAIRATFPDPEIGLIPNVRSELVDCVLPCSVPQAESGFLLFYAIWCPETGIKLSRAFTAPSVPNLTPGWSRRQGFVVESRLPGHRTLRASME